jgi:hypothetical protein
MCHKLPEYEQAGYAVCRSAGRRRWCARVSKPAGSSVLSIAESLSPAVSLFIRGGFRSHRQKTQRVDCVYTTRP